VKVVTILTILFGAVAVAAAGPLVLVEVEVAGVDDFEALRSGGDSRFILVGGFAYAALDEGTVATFDAGERAWVKVALAREDEVFLVLPPEAAYDGPSFATVECGGGNRAFVLTAEDAAGLVPLYAFNVLAAAEPEPRRAVSPSLVFDPAEADAVERVEPERLMATAERLQNFYSRAVTYHGNDDATAFLEEEYRKVIRTAVERQYFDAGPRVGNKVVANVVATIPGVSRPDEQVLVGAHFDSATLGSSSGGVVYSPGADDNASGTAAVLECARILSGYAFDRTLVFVAFNAEEIGLVGSEYYAAAAKDRGDDIRAMINLDMVAYDAGDLDAEAIGNGASYDMAELMAGKAAKYTSVDMVPRAGGATMSDHAPFWENGYLAIWEYEGWNDSSPHIHTTSDTVDTLRVEFFEEMTRILVATAYDLAGPNTSPLIGIVEPDGDDYADDSFTIRWWDVDADDWLKDATISLYWAEDNSGEGGTLIADGIPQNDRGNRGSYEWDTSSLPAGRYYVYARIEDGFNEPYVAASAGPVRVTHGSRVVAYPNPVRASGGAAAVTFDGLMPGDDVAVYDVAGAVVFEARAGSRRLTWDVGDVAGGVYFYRVVSAVVAETASGKVAVLK
jgi:Zn-dependent M28 family amino/carboxypeptidase